MIDSWEGKTLEELEARDWGEPSYQSALVDSCHRIRRKPLRDITVEELRLAIGQEMGLEFLLPIAVKHLSADPMAEGDFYPGDLMLKVLRVPIAVWNKSPALRTTRGELHWSACALLRECRTNERSLERGVLGGFPGGSP